MREHFRRHIYLHLDRFPTDLTDGFWSHCPQRSLQAGELVLQFSPNREVKVENVEEESIAEDEPVPNAGNDQEMEEEQAMSTPCKSEEESSDENDNNNQEI